MPVRAPAYLEKKYDGLSRRLQPMPSMHIAYILFYFTGTLLGLTTPCDQGHRVVPEAALSQLRCCRKSMFCLGFVHNRFTAYLRFCHESGKTEVCFGQMGKILVSHAACKLTSFDKILDFTSSCRLCRSYFNRCVGQGRWSQSHLYLLNDTGKSACLDYQCDMCSYNSSTDNAVGFMFHRMGSIFTCGCLARVPGSRM